MAADRKKVLESVPSRSHSPVRRASEKMRLLAKKALVPIIAFSFTVGNAAPSQAQPGKKPNTGQKGRMPVDEVMALAQKAWAGIKAKYPKAAEGKEMQFHVVGAGDFNSVEAKPDGAVKEGDGIAALDIYINKDGKLEYSDLVRVLCRMATADFYGASTDMFGKGGADASLLPEIMWVDIAQVEGFKKLEIFKNASGMKMAFVFVDLMGAEKFANAALGNGIGEMRKAFDAKYGNGAFGRAEGAANPWKEFMLIVKERNGDPAWWGARIGEVARRFGIGFAGAGI